MTLEVTTETHATPKPAVALPEFDPFAYGYCLRLKDLLKDLTDPPNVFSELGGSAWRKAVLCTEAALVLAAEPTVDASFQFPAAVFTRIRARQDAADTPEERAQFRELMERLTLNSASLSELCTKLRRRGSGLDALRALHTSLGAFLAHVVASEPGVPRTP